MPRKTLHRLSLVVLGALLLAACDAGGGATTVSTPTPVPDNPTAQSSLTKATIALGYIPDVQFAPFYVALSRGYYKDEGLDITLKNGIVTDLISQLGKGDVDFAVASGDELITARAQGIPVVYAMTWYRQYPVAAVSINGKGPTLKSPSDLKGRTIGVPGPYGSTYTGLLALLNEGNLTLKDVTLKFINFTQVASLSQGQVDVAMVYTANEPVQLRSQKYDVSVLPVAGYAKLASNGLATNEKTLSANPALIGKIVHATLRGIQATIDDPDSAFNDTLKYVPEAGGQNRDLQLQILKETVKLMQANADDPAAKQPLGWTDESVWTATQDFLATAQIIAKKGDVSKMFTNQFVQGTSQ